ncbi:uncharacterized protein LOC106130146 isoform X2 [Amyelois transitella]|uniref:uncharacterized protein LOC106130146 isoform X2 n=1 Tax=Amyelois transitella TaxID=680683 RepID=UPI00067C6B40|nr:uncharacterized protein LOC106130146 isoform X2 [Amyelois transitella]
MSNCHANLSSEQEQPEWVQIYYLRNSDTEFRCNICEHVITADEKSPELLEHITLNHKEVYDLHKDNPFSSVGFRIEFLQVVKNDNSDPLNREVIIGEVCEAATEEIAKPITGGTEAADILSDGGGHIVVTRNDSNIIVTSKKPGKSISLENRKRSWVWKYFEKVSHIMYRCVFCNVILSIKGCNTNNLNRHIRTKHVRAFQLETEGKKDEESVLLEMKEESYSEKDDSFIISESIESPQKLRSWVWMYFDRVSSSIARCKLCHRNISHGGNATGNMNRHLKMRHQKTRDSDHTWIWKVFEVNDEDFYTCKICQFQCLKADDLDKSINIIMAHLRDEHGVISGDQIITPACK